MNLFSAWIISLWRNPLWGLNMRFPFATKSPEDATTFSKWSVAATVIVSMSEYQPPYLTQQTHQDHRTTFWNLIQKEKKSPISNLFAMFVDLQKLDYCFKLSHLYKTAILNMSLVWIIVQQDLSTLPSSNIGWRGVPVIRRLVFRWASSRLGRPRIGTRLSLHTSTVAEVIKRITLRPDLPTADSRAHACLIVRLGLSLVSRKNISLWGSDSSRISSNWDKSGRNIFSTPNLGQLYCNCWISSFCLPTLYCKGFCNVLWIISGIVGNCRLFLSIFWILVNKPQSEHFNPGNIIEDLQKVCYNEVCKKQVAYEMRWNNFIQKEKEFKNLYFDLIKSHFCPALT